ncbi:MAG: hypothetical protein ACR2PT_20525, partial [Endozoicomonas sp.]
SGPRATGCYPESDTGSRAGCSCTCACTCSCTSKKYLREILYHPVNLSRGALVDDIIYTITLTAIQAES